MAEQPIRAVAAGGEPAALLLDAMGTLLSFADPAPLLRAAVRERVGVDVGEDAAARAIRAEIAFYRAHLHTGRDAGSLAALRRASAEAMRPELGAAASAPAHALTDALLAALRFEAYADAAPALRRLRAAGLRLVVVSNWDASLPERLAEAGLAPLLDGVVASAPFGAAKPDPAIFARGLELARVEAAAAWHVGDSEREDVAGARAAGVRALLLRRDGAAAPEGVTTIRSLAELPERLTHGEYPCRVSR
jgi:putative hydrolase of the HAD superfamily